MRSCSVYCSTYILSPNTLMKSVLHVLPLHFFLLLNTSNCVHWLIHPPVPWWSSLFLVLLPTVKLCDLIHVYLLIVSSLEWTALTNLLTAPVLSLPFASLYEKAMGTLKFSFFLSPPDFAILLLLSLLNTNPLLKFHMIILHSSESLHLN